MVIVCIIQHNQGAFADIFVRGVFTRRLWKPFHGLLISVDTITFKKWSGDDENKVMRLVKYSTEFFFFTFIDKVSYFNNLLINLFDTLARVKKGSLKNIIICGLQIL